MRERLCGGVGVDGDVLGGVLRECLEGKKQKGAEEKAKRMAAHVYLEMTRYRACARNYKLVDDAIADLV
jgi:hypothetical protein